MKLSPRFFLPETVYMELELRSEEVQGAHEIGGGAPLSRGQPVGPMALILSPKILINSEKCLRGFPGHFENFSFLHIKQRHGSSAEININPGYFHSNRAS